MPSRSGTLIKDRLEVLLRRSLTGAEMLKVEELALNMFTGPVLSYFEKLMRKPMKHDFHIVVAAAANSIKGAERSKTVKHSMTPRVANIYKKFDLFKPAMTDGEMQAVIQLADRFSDATIDSAIVSARSRGIKHVRYVLAICVGNVGKAQPRAKAKIKKTEEHILRPSAKAVDTAWDRVLANAADKELVNRMERGFLD